MVSNNDFFEFGLEVGVNFAKSRVERTREGHPTCAFIPLDDIHIVDNGISHFVLHFAGSLVRNPRVNTSSARKDPQKIGKVEIFLANLRNNHHGNFQVRKATFANFGSRAARSDLIVLVHINIENHFLLQGHKGFLV